MKSVKSINHLKSLPTRQAGVILTIYDSVKAHGGEIKADTKEGEGAKFTIIIPTLQSV